MVQAEECKDETPNVGTLAEDRDYPPRLGAGSRLGSRRIKLQSTNRQLGASRRIALASLLDLQRLWLA